MKKMLTIALAGAAIAATLSFVMTGPAPDNPMVGEAKAAEAEPEPANSIVLAQMTSSIPSYDRGPRIIVVPQAFERDRVNSRASIDSTDDDDDIAPRRNGPPVRSAPRWAPPAEPQRVEKPYVAPPRRVETPVRPRTETRTVRHIDMSKPKAEPELQPIPQPPIPQPQSPRRAVLSAPPMPAEGPTPIRPTPRFDSKPDAKPDSKFDSKVGPRPDSKFGAKAEADAQSAEVSETLPPGEITADSPPPGYTPPPQRPN